jgi:hypothetical protein
MERICPNPTQWHEVYKKLVDYSETHKCYPPSPPKALVLSGWNYTNDLDKKNRWEQTVQWSKNNGCSVLVEQIPKSEFYSVENLTTYAIGPMGGPMHREWDYGSKIRPPTDLLKGNIKTLSENWDKIAGSSLSVITSPIKFTGKKARRLLISADFHYDPPWGTWIERSELETERRTFTDFRKKINKYISPHEVDHIDFIDNLNRTNVST